MSFDLCPPSPHLIIEETRYETSGVDLWQHFSLQNKASAILHSENPFVGRLEGFRKQLDDDG